ncbi:MAG: hypothetical protein ACI8ZM_000532 [Crocinitomix sp.]|jgi:hypothetical protein
MGDNLLVEELNIIDRIIDESNLINLLKAEINKLI